MDNEYYGAASTPTEDFLAHYGIKGMKWGVRKAIQNGNDRALRRQYKKAEKKLAKLEKLGSNGKKYAKRAAAYGAGAAVAGGLAAAGTSGVSKAINKSSAGAGKAYSGVGKGMHAVGGLMARSGVPGVQNAGAYMMGKGRVMSRRGTKVEQGMLNAANAVNKWGNSKSIISSVNGVEKTPLKNVSNNTIARIGAGAVGAGLGIAAGRNAYRAATAKKHAAQAKEFRAEMNKAFAGTKYANGIPSKKKKNRR